MTIAPVMAGGVRPSFLTVVGAGWLYRNAKATGSAYWWNRYYECIGYY
jgi:hypothetical protein